ncbi:ATP-dependent nuclease [Listeria seeligeri]|uniref:ATP-dependent nuclease n=1 Tax=Listeria seeligeri TaxID=1640 RepID=UPI00162400ED|nr:AAA family ATPase [Listeria seeligeri]MBC1581150.1 ATP-binding protein [Listeria seeligeri]MBC2232622.1 ATP-binding protein [Listeria seeligeri]MBC2247775.1 ATP-binding protein [Listeria seeligeri]MBF2402618.1 AAA family ATPase [Listeria seeligeri]
MFISKITLKNFRCFEEEHILEFKSGINYFVGDNNCGKTTIFKAIEFIRSGKNKEDWISKGKEVEDVSVEIEFSGEDIQELIEMESLKKYKNYISSDSKMLIMRSSKPGTWIDSKGKEKNLELKQVRVFNPEANIFENPTGIDSMISDLFDAQFVYSDLKNEDYQDFGKTKIVGKLINDITKDFQQQEPWKNLQIAHQEAFGENGLTPILKDMQERIENILSEQYGKTKVEFNFGLPEIENFFKTGSILLEENGIKTHVSEKGTGMQRALALTLIQVYSQIDKKTDAEVSRPIIFFIDEPETFLHPHAQDKLLSSLERISESSQIFITTHSPYLLKKFNKDTHRIKVFSRREEEPRVRDGEELNLFPFSPSWGEINYYAFNVVSEEFHNELFGFLHSKVAEKNKCYEDGKKTVSKTITSFDNWLEEQEGVTKTDEKHRNNHNNYIDKTMPVYIRNYIDHPGEDFEGKINKREKPNTSEIKKSIDFMVELNQMI